MAVWYDSQEFTGQYQARGGQSTAGAGGPGTVYVEHRGQAKRLYVDNGKGGTPRTVSILSVDKRLSMGGVSGYPWVGRGGGGGGGGGTGTVYVEHRARPRGSTSTPARALPGP